MSKLFRAISKDYLRSVVIGLISTLIVVPLGCVLVFIPLWLVTQFDTSIWVLIVSLGLFMLILFGGGFGALGLALYRRKRWLDVVFEPLGLSGNRYMISGREYKGTVDGREVTVRFYRGPSLDLYISTPLQTRMEVVERTQVGLGVAKLVQREPLAPDDPDLEAFSIFALDEAWGRALLAKPGARTALLRLWQAGESWALMRQVLLKPGAFHLRLYRNKNLFKYGIEPEDAQEWLDDLLALARAAESLPAPQVTAEETGAERMVRTGRTMPVALAFVAGLLGIPLCATMVVAVVVLLLTAQ